jgi:hypothetical protein
MNFSKKNYFWNSSAHYFFVVLGFKLQALHLSTKHYTTWPMPLVHFSLAIFQKKFCAFCLRLASDCNTPTCVACVAGITDENYYTLLVLWDGASLTLLPWLALNYRCPISASQTAGTLGVNHHNWHFFAHFVIYYCILILYSRLLSFIYCEFYVSWLIFIIFKDTRIILMFNY